MAEKCYLNTLKSCPRNPKNSPNFASFYETGAEYFAPHLNAARQRVRASPSTWAYCQSVGPIRAQAQTIFWLHFEAQVPYQFRIRSLKYDLAHFVLRILTFNPITPFVNFFNFQLFYTLSSTSYFYPLLFLFLFSLHHSPSIGCFDLQKQSIMHNCEQELTRLIHMKLIQAYNKCVKIH